MRNGKAVRLNCAGLLFAAVSAFGQTTMPLTRTSMSSLPPVGLASTETAQVNVVNTVPASPSGAAAACTGSIAFSSTAGAIIGSATAFNVGSGQIFSVKLPYSSAETSGTRTVIRATISLTTISPVAANGTAEALPPPCMLAYSLETYDTATGVTHVFAPGNLTQSSIRPVLGFVPAARQ